DYRFIAQLADGEKFSGWRSGSRLGIFRMPPAGGVASTDGNGAVCTDTDESVALQYGKRANDSGVCAQHRGTIPTPATRARQYSNHAEFVAESQDTGFDFDDGGGLRQQAAFRGPHETRRNRCFHGLRPLDSALIAISELRLVGLPE